MISSSGNKLIFFSVIFSPLLPPSPPFLYLFNILSKVFVELLSTSYISGFVTLVLLDKRKSWFAPKDFLLDCTTWFSFGERGKAVTALHITLLGNP